MRSSVDLPEPLRPTTRDPVAGRNRQLRAVQQRRAAEGQANVSQLQEGRHMKQAPDAAGVTLRAASEERERSAMANQAALTALARLVELAQGACSRARSRAEFADDPGRFERIHVTLDDLLFDYSKQRIDAPDPQLAGRARQGRRGRGQARRDVRAARSINTTEQRAVLHTALRNFSGKPVLVDGKDVDARGRRRAREDAELRRRRARGPACAARSASR